MVARITVPMPDLHGSDDSAEGLASVSQREKVKEEGVGGAYTSQQVKSANHFFDGKEDKLVDSVNTWLTGVGGGG
jgi:alpha/beta superfamily hydrolase